MEIAYDDNALRLYAENAMLVSSNNNILIDQYLENAIEIDVDLIRDQNGKIFIAGIMEHIEEAGIHSGDSACVMPPQSISKKLEKEVIRISKKVAKEMRIVGAANLQLAIKDSKVFLLEANPRASRTLPFVSKSTGYPLARLAVRAMLGQKLNEIPKIIKMKGASVKVPTFSWLKITGLDTVLGPEMKSTGEAMGHGPTFGTAYLKAMKGGNKTIPTAGTVFLSVSNKLKLEFGDVAQELRELGFKLIATKGTAAHLRKKGIDSEAVSYTHLTLPTILLV